MPYKQINVHIDEATHRAYKTWCSRRGITMVGTFRTFVRKVLDRASDACYVLADEDIADIIRSTTKLFVENRAQHDLDDEDNWADIEMYVFSKIEGALVPEQKTEETR